MSALWGVGWLMMPAAARGQADQTLEFERPESWAMARITSLTLFTGLGAGAIPPDSIRSPGLRLGLGFEGGWIPALDREERMIGFYGTKEEDTNKTPFLGRVRLSLGGESGWLMELGIVPPVELGGARPMLVAGSFGWGTSFGSVRVGVRAHAQTGSIRGDITCPRRIVAAGDDPDRNPFRCEEPSTDRVHPRYYGIAADLSTRLGAWHPYLEASLQRHEPKFRVNARYNGIHDQNTLRTRGTGWSVQGGVARDLRDGVRLSAEGFVAPLSIHRRPDQPRERASAWNVRAGVHWLRK